MAFFLVCVYMMLGTYPTALMCLSSFPYPEVAHFRQYTIRATVTHEPFKMIFKPQY